LDTIVTNRNDFRTNAPASATVAVFGDKLMQKSATIVASVDRL